MKCRKTQRALENVKIDCILVSPQLRALQTCFNVFNGKKIPTFVEPLLTGPLRSCSDVNTPVHLKKVLFEGYNFAPTESLPPLWFLKFLPSEQQQICEEAFASKNIENDMQKRF